MHLLMRFFSSPQNRKKAHKIFRLREKMQKVTSSKEKSSRDNKVNVGRKEAR